MALVGFSWIALNGFTTRERVEVAEASYRPDGSLLALVVNTCRGDPKLDEFEETESAIHVAVVSTVAPFEASGDCQDAVEVALERPLGQRQVVDLTSGNPLDVTVVDRTS